MSALLGEATENHHGATCCWDDMDLFAILSAEALWDEQPTSGQCAHLLGGLPFESLRQYAWELCRVLSAARQEGLDNERLHILARAFLEQHTTSEFSDELLDSISRCQFYAGEKWVLADQQRVAQLVLAYARANSAIVPGDSSAGDIDDIVRAQLIVNDLVTPSQAATRDDLGLLDVLPAYSMARSLSIDSTLPRAFDIIGVRLLALQPQLGEAFSKRWGVDALGAVTIVFGVFLMQILPVLDPEFAKNYVNPEPNGILTLTALDASHAGDRGIRAIISRLSMNWAELHRMARQTRPSDPSILGLLRQPLIRLNEEEFWCFDPDLLLSVASDGLFWLVKDSYEAGGGDGQDVFSAFGHAFENYLADFVSCLRDGDVQRGDEIGDGLPDLMWVEGDTLVAVEVKASTFRDDVKWSDDRDAISREIQKIVKDNQIMNAVSRLYEQQPDWVSRVKRVSPVYLFRDSIYATPLLEPEIGRHMGKPSIAWAVDDPYVLPVGELEIAGAYVREGQLSLLLHLRREISPQKAVGLPQMIARYKSKIRKRIGDWHPAHDAHEETRKALNRAMGEFLLEYGELPRS